MALTKCPECGKKVSDKAPVCIHCGCPIDNSTDLQQTAGGNEVKMIETDKSNTQKERIIKPAKIAVIIAVIVAILAIAATVIYFVVLKPTYEETVANYNNAVNNYSETVSAYEAKRTEIDTENKKLIEAYDGLQVVVSSGEKPYDPEKIPNANAAINEGKIALVSIPVWEEKELKPAADYNVFQANTINEDAERIEAHTSEISRLIETMQSPDYSAVMGVIAEAQSALEFSIKQMKQVTCPSESFVLERITNIREQAGMIDVISLTEDNDPENYIGKAGWYTVKVIFHHKDVEHYGLDSGLYTLSEIGNPAGGCIEVYRTEEDAQRRAEYLKGLEGTVSSPGARTVCGTIVIRVSDDLKTSYQQELLDLIVAELIRMDGVEEKPPAVEPPATEEQSTAEPPATETPTTDPVTTQPVDRYQEAVAEAINLANYFFPTSRIFVKQVLVSPSLEQKFEAFTEDQAEYAIQHANIDWKEHALYIAKGYMDGHVNSIPTKDELYADLLYDYEDFTDIELQYAVDNCGISQRENAVNDMWAYWDHDYNVIVTLYDFSDYLSNRGYDDETIEYVLERTSGYYRGEAVENEQERVGLLYSYGYTRDAIVNWYAKAMDYVEAEALVDSY